MRSCGNAGFGREPGDSPTKTKLFISEKKVEWSRTQVFSPGGFIMDSEENAGKPLKILDILSEIEEEIYKNEQAIKLRAAIEYMVGLVDEAYRETFKEAEEKATTIEDLKKILHAIKRHIGQETAINIFKL